MRRALKLVS